MVARSGAVSLLLYRKSKKGMPVCVGLVGLVRREGSGSREQRAEDTEKREEGAESRGKAPPKY
jgi:hypothetical protein